MSRNNGKQPWSVEEDNYLEVNYPNEEWENILQALPGRTQTSVIKRAVKKGIKRSREAINKGISSANSLLNNKDYFKTWSREMAYILGLLYADGWVDTNGNCIGISLHYEDEYIIEAIKQQWQYKGNIVCKKSQRQMKVSSPEMRADLSALGIKPDKTHNCYFPEQVPEEYLSDFVRGFFDGDGSVFIDKSTVGVSFIGTYEMISQINDIMSTTVGVQKKTMHKKHKTEWLYTIRYNGQEAFALLEWMYDGNPELFLQRKYNKYIEATIERSRIYCNYQKRRCG